MVTAKILQHTSYQTADIDTLNMSDVIRRGVHCWEQYVIYGTKPGSPRPYDRPVYAGPSLYRTFATTFAASRYESVSSTYLRLIDNALMDRVASYSQAVHKDTAALHTQRGVSVVRLRMDSWSSSRAGTKRGASGVARVICEVADRVDYLE